MWDVIWTDPDRELVGERRARKEKDRGSNSEAGSARHYASRRSSFSTRSSISSSDAALSFSRGQKGIAKSKTDRKGKQKELVAESTSSWRSTSWSKASSTASSALASLSIASARSPLSPTFDIRSRRSSGLATTNESSLHSRPSIASRTAKESHDPELNHELSLGLMQHGNTASVIQPRESYAHDTVFSAGGKLTEPEPIPPLKSDCQLPLSTQTSSESNVYTLHNTKLSVGELESKQGFNNIGNSEPPAVPPKSPLRSTSRSCSLFAIPGNPSGWLSTEEWCQRASEIPYHDNTAQDDSKVFNMAALTEEVINMMGSEPERVLDRLRKTPEDDSLVADLERKRWLMCTAQHLDRDASSPVTFDLLPDPTDNAYEAVILFESRNTAAYLAAQNPGTNFYHVARHPLRNATFTNVIPLSLSSFSVDILSLALPLELDLIYSLAMQSLCPAPGLVRTLLCLRSHLKPKTGKLHLTLIDALPRIETLGPHLRRWLESHLLVNLAPYNLTHTPTKLFPKCLAAASLRGVGSKRVKTKFFASESSIRGTSLSEEDRQHEDHDPDPAIRKLRTELRAKAELRCLAGRMLWKEVWGPYVQTPLSSMPGEQQTNDGKAKEGCNSQNDVKAVSWWWDDEACMAECVELGTFWEYHTIEAVRST